MDGIEVHVLHLDPVGHSLWAWGSVEAGAQTSVHPHIMGLTTACVAPHLAWAFTGNVSVCRVYTALLSGSVNPRLRLGPMQGR